MFRSTMSSASRWALLAIAATAIVGCNSTKQSTNNSPAAAAQQSIAAIKSNPNIPEQAKAHIIGAIQQRASATPAQH